MYRIDVLGAKNVPAVAGVVVDAPAEIRRAGVPGLNRSGHVEINESVGNLGIRHDSVRSGERLDVVLQDRIAVQQTELVGNQIAAEREPRTVLVPWRSCQHPMKADHRFWIARAVTPHGQRRKTDRHTGRHLPRLISKQVPESNRALDLIAIVELVDCDKAFFALGRRRVARAKLSIEGACVAVHAFLKADRQLRQ